MAGGFRPRAQPGSAEARSYLVRYLEPGRKRKRRRLPVVHALWLLAAVIALALAVQGILR